jgi:hypothetical protein
VKDYTLKTPEEIEGQYKAILKREMDELQTPINWEVEERIQKMIEFFLKGNS